MTFFALLQHTITNAEIKHQQRAQGRGFARLTDAFPGRKLSLVAAVMALAIFWGEFIGALTGGNTGWIVNSIGGLPAMITLVVMGVIHFRVLLATLLFASDAIAREKRGRTWDSLLLTGLDARQIIVGKWWATLRSVWRDYAFLALLRAGVVVGLGAGLSQITLRVNAAVGGPVVSVRPDAGEVLLVGVVVVAYTFANAGFTAAVGLAASALSRRNSNGTIAFALAILARLAVVLGTVGALAVTAEAMVGAGAGHTQIVRLLNLLWLTMLDNGTVLTSQLTDYGNEDKSFVLLVLLIGLALYALLTGAALWLAVRLAVRQNALRPKSA